MTLVQFFLLIGQKGRAHSTQMSTWKMEYFRWFLTVYYVPKLSLLLAAIGKKLTGHHGGLQIGKYTAPDEEVSVEIPQSNFSVSEGQKGLIPRKCQSGKRPVLGGF